MTEYDARCLVVRVSRTSVCSDCFINAIEEVRKRCGSLLMGGDSKEIEQMREDCLKITEKKTRHVSKTRGTS